MSMDVRRFFRLGFQHEHRIDFLTERIRQSRANLARITQSYSDAPRSGAMESSVEAMVVRLEELAEKLAEAEVQLSHWSRCAEEIIRELSEQRQRELFSYRYLDRLPWDRVSERLFLSRAQVFRLHDQTLPKAQNILDSLINRGDFVCDLADA